MLQLTRILDQTSEDLVNSVRNGTALDTSITVAQLEENPLLSKRVAWRDHIHPLVCAQVHKNPLLILLFVPNFVSKYRKDSECSHSYSLKTRATI